MAPKLVYGFVATLIYLQIQIWSLNANCAKKASGPTCLFTKTLPTKIGKCYLINCRHGNFMASIGNGFLGTVVFSDTIHVAGVYNGKAYVKKGHGWPVDYYNHTRRARIPSSNAISFKANLPGVDSYALDTEDGVFYRWFAGAGFEITQRIYAHRRKQNLLVNEIQVEKNTSQLLTLQLSSNIGNMSVDINFQEVQHPGDTNIVETQKAYVGAIREGETVHSTKPEVAVVYNEIKKRVTVPDGVLKKTFYFITAIATSLQGSTPLDFAWEQWKDAWKVKEDLFQSHRRAWNELWNSGNIFVGGNLYLAQSVSASMYNILSSTRAGISFGLSPGGLPGGEEYLGHTFWDQDIWMYPVLVTFFPQLAKEALNYRYDRLNAAKTIAKSYGFRGAMFPWESALTGVEVSPGQVYGRNQIHITSDIAFATKQYWLSTGDKQWMKDRGFELIYSTAKFWASRVTWDADHQHYVINDVMPPDEHTYPANNSVYTNVGAKLNLDFAIKLGKVLGRHIPPQWHQIRNKIFIPFNTKEQYHPQHDGFNKTDIVKQADTILIGYPLMYDMSKQVRANDLELYGRITNPNGPAMTHSMFAIGWLEVGNRKKASAAFVKNFNNIQGPFKVWSEIRFGRGATNFITGAGGFLQGVINGYGGIRLKEKGLFINGNLPDNSTYLLIHGIKLQGNSISVNITKSGVFAKLLSKQAHAKTLVLQTGGKVLPFELNRKEELVAKMGIIKEKQPVPSSSALVNPGWPIILTLLPFFNV